MGLHRLANIACFLAISLILAWCGGCGTAPSRILTQPASQSVVVGQTATFSVTAAGQAPLSYQWRKGTVPIPGASGSIYTTAATTTSDSGSQFSVVVSNSAGNATSNEATLTVSAATDVLTHHNEVISFLATSNSGSSITPLVLSRV